MPEIKKFPVLSTGHLKKETANWLNQVILEDARFVSGLSDERIENGPVVAGYADRGSCRPGRLSGEGPEDATTEVGAVVFGRQVVGKSGLCRVASYACPGEVQCHGQGGS